MKLINSLFMIFYVVFNTIIILIFDLGKIATNIVIPLGFVFYCFFRKNQFKIFINLKEFRLYLLLIVLAFFSVLYTDFFDHALAINNRFLIVSIFSFTLFSFSLTSLSNIYKICIAYILALIIIIYFAAESGLEIGGNFRFEIDEINANTYGYYIFTGLYAYFILLNVQKKYKTVSFIVLVALIIVSYIIIIASASRSSLIMISLLVISNIYLIFQNYFNKLSYKFVISIISLAFLSFLVNYVYTEFLQESLVIERFAELETRESPRQFHFRKAIEIGLDNPFLGVGTGGYSQIPKAFEQGSFSHNTYTEIFANHGFVGLSIYLFFFYYIFKRLIRLLKITKDKIVIKQISVFLLLFLFYNIFYVTHLTAEFTGMLFVVLAHIIIIEKNHNKTKIINTIK